MTEDSEMAMDCAQAVELLPWYLNRTLGEPEAAALEAHLGACEACRRQLGESARVAWITEQHLPAGTLVEYGFGEDPEGVERSVVERHLAHCDECREELRTLQLVAGLRLEDEAPARSRPTSAWVLGLAASLLVACLAALWWLSPTVVTHPEPQGNVALVELLPESFGIRGAQVHPPLPADRARTLVLVTDLALGGEAYRATLATPEDETLWVVLDLRPTPDGGFTLHLPVGSPLPAGSSIRLEERLGNAWSVIETYPIPEGGSEMR